MTPTCFWGWIPQICLNAIQKRLKMHEAASSASHPIILPFRDDDHADYFGIFEPIRAM